MSDTAEGAETTPADPPKTEQAPTHTEEGAPTDAAHQGAGDGSLTGSTPAGLSADELLKQANSNKGADPGTG